MTGRAIIQSVRALVLVGVVGCGVSDYEKQMDKQRQRIQEFDDTHRLLDDPLEAPTIQAQGAKTDTPAWPFEPFLRLPKGYGHAVKEKDKLPYNNTCFRYTGSDPGENFFVAAAFVAKSKKLAKFREYTSDDFRIYVKSAIDEFYTKATGAKLKVTDKFQAQPIEVQRFGPLSGEEGKIIYDLITYTDADNKALKEHVAFLAYFHKDGDKQICIVVHRPLTVPNEPAFKKAMEACLGSLDLSADAPNRRGQFFKAKTSRK